MSLPQVHKMLAEFRLIPGLNNLFDKLIWRKQTSTHVLHGQNQNCDCSPVRRPLCSGNGLNGAVTLSTSIAALTGLPLSISLTQEISFKIQFLRLLQSFSDHHE